MALISFTVLYYLFFWCFCYDKYCCLYTGVVRLRVGPVVQTDQPLTASHSQPKHSLYFSIILFVMNGVQFKVWEGSDECITCVNFLSCMCVIFKVWCVLFCVRACTLQSDQICLTNTSNTVHQKRAAITLNLIFLFSVAWLMEHYSHHIGAVSDISYIFLFRSLHIFLYFSQPFPTARSVGQGEGCG